MLSAQYNFCASCIQGAMCAKADMALALLAHHSFALAYAPKVSLFSSLLWVYQGQVRTIAGATLHHMSMCHQKYATWAYMMVYRMRAHKQWLNRSMEEAGRLYHGVFQSTSRAIRNSYTAMVCTHHQEAYTSAGAQKQRMFSQWSAPSAT